MTRISYDTAETLVYDPVASNRNATRSALYAMGFRRIETVASLEAFNECIMRRPPDLALCETLGTEEELCRSIQGVRQGMSAYNPFIVIIVTAWENHNGLVSRVLNSGADDLLLRPFSTSMLETRIRAHVERRKGFVITSDYIGPDRRRSDSSRASNIDLFQPPNSLKMKVKERITAEEAALRLDGELKTARDALTGEKLRRDAFQICILWRMLQETVRDGKEVGGDLPKLSELAKAVSRRCRDTQFEEAVEWCDAIHGAIEGLELGVDRNASLHLLGHAALNLNQVFSPGKTQDEHLAEIDATLVKIKSRRPFATA